MSRYHAYLKKAVTYLENYKGEQPFSIYCKQLFAADRKMGSTDRRLIRHYCYSYFRVGAAFVHYSIEEKILASVFLLSTSPDPLVTSLKPDWSPFFSEDIEVRMRLFSATFNWSALFPYELNLSGNIELNDWLRSQLRQPDVFIRLRPGKEKIAKEHIGKLKLPVHSISPTCISFPAAVNLDLLPGLNRDYVIQDYSSQQIDQLLQLVPTNVISSCWDCCAASGGKSILIKDRFPAAQLTVSDIRASILNQLKNRLRDAAIATHQVVQLDLEKRGSVPSSFLFDLVVADVPCTGSGTWGRTPEERVYFTSDQLEQYVAKQKKILSHITTTIKPGGYLLYCTCSVFEKENEQQITEFVASSGFKVVKMQLFNGMPQKADSLFGALLQKISN